MTAAGPHSWKRAMRARSPDEPHRTATPLELFFDLVFVVAIAQASDVLHHEIAAGHVAIAVLNYAIAPPGAAHAVDVKAVAP